MMVTIHLLSLVLGFIIGLVFGCFVLFFVVFSEGGRWSYGFGEGFKAGIESEKERRREE